MTVGRSSGGAAGGVGDRRGLRGAARGRATPGAGRAHRAAGDIPAVLADHRDHAACSGCACRSASRAGSTCGAARPPSWSRTTSRPGTPSASSSAAGGGSRRSRRPSTSAAAARSSSGGWVRSRCGAAMPESTAWAMQMSQEALARGGMIGIYPEGTRSPDGRLHKLHKRVLIPLLQANPDVAVHAVTMAYEKRPGGRVRVTGRISPPVAARQPHGHAGRADPHPHRRDDRHRRPGVRRRVRADGEAPPKTRLASRRT